MHVFDDPDRRRAVGGSGELRDHGLPEPERIVAARGLGDAERAQARPHGEVRGGIGELPRAAADDGRGAPLGLARERLGERALADPGFPAEDDEPAASLRGLLQGRGQHAKLVGTTGQHLPPHGSRTCTESISCDAVGHCGSIVAWALGSRASLHVCSSSRRGRPTRRRSTASSLRIRRRRARRAPPARRAGPAP